MSTTMGIKIDEKTRERVRTLAESRERTPHWVIRTALAEYLEREEAREREKAEDLERWERFALGGPAVDNAAAVAWLDDLAHGKKRPCPR